MSDDTAQARAAEVIREKQMEKVAKLDAVEASAQTLEHIAALRTRFPARPTEGRRVWVPDGYRVVKLAVRTGCDEAGSFDYLHIEDEL